MLRHKKTNQVFNDRQDAKKILGHSNYNKAVKNREIEYLNDTQYTLYQATDVII